MDKSNFKKSNFHIRTYLYYDDCEVGKEFISPSKTVTEADVTTFAGLSGDCSEIHTSEEFAKKTIFGERIAHGLLGLAIAQGLATRAGAEEIASVASLNWNWNFKKPIKIGDTVHAKLWLKNKRKTKKPGYGIFCLFEQLINHRGEIVQEGEHTIMVEVGCGVKK